MAVGRVQFLTSCWPEISIFSLLCVLLLGTAHNMAAAFIRGKKEGKEQNNASKGKIKVFV